MLQDISFRPYRNSYIGIDWGWVVVMRLVLNTVFSLFYLCLVSGMYMTLALTEKLLYCNTRDKIGRIKMLI